MQLLEIIAVQIYLRQKQHICMCQIVMQQIIVLKYCKVQIQKDLLNKSIVVMRKTLTFLTEYFEPQDPHKK